MSLLLTEDEHDALLADRARLEWLATQGITWHGGKLWVADGDGIHETVHFAHTLRQAVDKARGVA